MKKNMLSFCACIFLLSLHVDVNAQQRQISGIVVNSDGNGVPSATIIVIETKEATTTNDQGKYSIIASTGQHLKVSSVGYLNNSVAIGKGNELSISLEASNKELSEVVVTALGIKREKKSLGYATAHLTSNDLTSVCQKTLKFSVINCYSRKVVMNRCA